MDWTGLSHLLTNAYVPLALLIIMTIVSIVTHALVALANNLYTHRENMQRLRLKERETELKIEQERTRREQQTRPKWNSVSEDEAPYEQGYAGEEQQIAPQTSTTKRKKI